MRRRHVRTASVVVLLGLLLAASTLAAGAPAVDRWVIAGGGGHVEAGSYALDGTIGQAVAGSASAGTYDLCSGFWCNVGGEWRLHLPLVLRNY